MLHFHMRFKVPGGTPHEEIISPDLLGWDVYC
jgi:hypothetical protein